MQELIGLDFETYSDVDLQKHGLKRYLDSPHFTPLIAKAVRRDGPLSAATIQVFDFIQDTNAKADLRKLVSLVMRYGTKIVAHNAGFEQGVLDRMGMNLTPDNFIDSAVVARAVGGESKLEVAAPQLTRISKLETGMQLIKLFSIPGKYQEKHSTKDFVADIILDHPDEWEQFADYCEVDALAGLTIAENYLHYLSRRELRYMWSTMRMNTEGWHVDLPTVQEMKRRYEENREQTLADFRARHGADDLNLGSMPQLKQWCADRGVKTVSFDKEHVARYAKAIEKKLGGGIAIPLAQYQGYEAVLDLMRTKQVLGGSSLSKLDVILNITAADGRLYDQYVHCGAGQTLRATGRSVQMQNLKRIGDNPGDMVTLFDDDVEWDNDELARNLRQVFVAEHQNGAMVVGDLASVESRGLCWIANDQKKLKAIRDGLDLYKVLAADMFGVQYSAVTKEQRQAGKVGVLSCGYGAGPVAVRDFAAGMGIELAEGEATKIVTDWRAANPMVLSLWDELHDMMLSTLVSSHSRGHGGWSMPDGFHVRIVKVDTPISLRAQAGPGVQSLALEVWHENMTKLWLRRFFHGCYVHGRNVRYYRPAERKTGDLWKDTFRHPKTKQILHYELYGGKLAGILTQSFCRELFYQVLEEVDVWCRNHDEIRLVGQFHDEIVLDWRPSDFGFTLESTTTKLQQLMSDPGVVKSFPLAAEIKSDYRYTK
jgi:DNA polymerase